MWEGTRNKCQSQSDQSYIGKNILGNSIPLPVVAQPDRAPTHEPGHRRYDAEENRHIDQGGLPQEAKGILGEFMSHPLLSALEAWKPWQG